MTGHALNDNRDSLASNDVSHFSNRWSLILAADKSTLIVLGALVFCRLKTQPGFHHSWQDFIIELIIVLCLKEPSEMTFLPSR